MLDPALLVQTVPEQARLPSPRRTTQGLPFIFDTLLELGGIGNYAVTRNCYANFFCVRRLLPYYMGVIS